jgi:hypothetical protein
VYAEYVSVREKERAHIDELLDHEALQLGVVASADLVLRPEILCSSKHAERERNTDKEKMRARRSKQ